jgi:glycine/D-amino acid oxidase-like deaminating enzyme
LERSEIGEATGTNPYVCALLDRRGGHINPLGFARGLAQAAVQAGAKVHGSSPVTKLSRNGLSWSLATPSGTVQADRVILATNGYTDDLWPGLRRTVVPVYSGIVATEPIPEAIARAVFPRRSSLYELGRVTVYYRLDALNRLLMGGRCQQWDATRAVEMPFLARYAHRLWPQLRPFKFTHGWNGQPAPGILVCLGYNGRGVAMATAMGPELARRLLGGAPIEINMPITDMRGIPLHGFWRVGVAARMAYDRVRDHLRI